MGAGHHEYRSTEKNMKLIVYLVALLLFGCTTFNEKGQTPPRDVLIEVLDSQYYVDGEIVPVDQISGKLAPFDRVTLKIMEKDNARKSVITREIQEANAELYCVLWGVRTEAWTD